MGEFFQLQLGKYGEISVSEGSVKESHVDALTLSEYRQSVACPVHLIDATEKEQQIIPKSSEKFFSLIEVNELTSVYQELYPAARIEHVPRVHEHFHEVTVLGERFVSKRVKGKYSAVVDAYWAAIDGSIAQSCSQLRVGVIQNFIRHTISLNANNSAKRKKLTHIFAKVHWYRIHPKENWFHPRVLVSPDMQMAGAAAFLPISRILARCGVIADTVMFDYGNDSVVISTMISPKFCLICS